MPWAVGGFRAERKGKFSRWQVRFPCGRTHAILVGQFGSFDAGVSGAIAHLQAQIPGNVPAHRGRGLIRARRKLHGEGG